MIHREYAPHTVVVIDDHPLFRKGVVQLVAMSPDMRVVAEASGGEEGAEIVCRLQPDLTLLDLHMKGLGGIATLARIKAHDPGLCVVVLTVSDAPDDVLAAIRAGADGYLLKDAEPELLLQKLQDALSGQTVMSESLSARLAGAIREEAVAKQRNLGDLTEREREILAGLAQGLSNKLLARRLDITEGTVKVHVKNLLRKLGFRSRVEAAVWAVGEGALP